MRQLDLGFVVAATLSAASLVGAIGCTATGSSTIIANGQEGGTDSATGDPASEPDGGTTTKKDSGSQVDDYEALFGPPASSVATPDSLQGLWAGIGVNGQDMRIRFRASSIVLALRCFSDPAIGMSVAASVSSSSVKTLESKKLGNPSTCGISVTPDELPSCATASYPCFTLKGTTLDLANTFEASGSFTKLSD